MCPSPSVGRPAVKAFRLSDVPPEVRMKAAQKCADEARASASDPLDAVFESLKLDAVAADPEKAAETMKDECRNGLHVVTLDEWERATSPRRRW